MEKVIHVHLHRVRPVRPSAPKRARTHDCTCQKDRRAKDAKARAKDGPFAPAGMEWCSRCNGTGEVGGKECPRCQGSGLVEETGDSKWPRDKAAQDALDQENARELSGLAKHEWNKLSPAKRAEWIQKFAKHKGRTDAKPKDGAVSEGVKQLVTALQKAGRTPEFIEQQVKAYLAESKRLGGTDSKRSKDAAFGEGDEVFINPRYGGGTGRVVEASPSGHFFVVRTRKGSMSFHESDISEDPFPGQREEDAAPRRGKGRTDAKPKDEATHPAMQTSSEVQKIVNEIKAYKPQIEAARGSERAKQLRRQQAALVSHLQEHFRTSLARSEWVAN
jgi:hypothetical protein